MAEDRRRLDQDDFDDDQEFMSEGEGGVAEASPESEDDEFDDED